MDGELKNKEGVEIKEKDGVVYIDDYQPVKHKAGEGESGEMNYLTCDIYKPAVFPCVLVI